MKSGPSPTADTCPSSGKGSSTGSSIAGTCRLGVESAPVAARSRLGVWVVEPTPLGPTSEEIGPDLGRLWHEVEQRRHGLSQHRLDSILAAARTVRTEQLNGSVENRGIEAADRSCELHRRALHFVVRCPGPF